MNYKSAHNLEFEFGFQKNFKNTGDTYIFKGYQIYDTNDNYICNCDITAMNMEYNKNNCTICAIIALNAYFEGIERGKKQTAETLKQILGV